MKLLLFLTIINLVSSTRWSAHYYNGSACVEVSQNICLKCYDNDINVYFVIECGNYGRALLKSYTSNNNEYYYQDFRTNCTINYYNNNKCIDAYSIVQPTYTISNNNYRIDRCENYSSRSNSCQFMLVDHFNILDHLLWVAFVAFLLVIIVLDKIFEQIQKWRTCNDYQIIV